MHSAVRISWKEEATNDPSPNLNPHSNNILKLYLDYDFPYILRPPVALLHLPASFTSRKEKRVYIN